METKMFLGRYGVIGALGALLLALGAHPSIAAPKKPAAAPRVPGKGAPAQSEFLPIEKLTPLPSGSGLLVCSPVVKGADSGTAEFGQGCGRWLQLFVGGQGALGKTPLWTPVDMFAWRTVPSPQLQPDAAVRLAPKLGVTHVATGEIQGNATQCTLTYRLWKAPGVQPVGEAVVLTGSREQVVAGLPGMAGKLARSLGVKSPILPAKVGETAEDLRFLGSIPWIPGGAITGPRLETLSGMAQRTVATGPAAGKPYLGGFLYFINRGAMRDSSVVSRLARPLALALPNNTIVLGEVGRQLHWATRSNPSEFPSEVLQQQRKQFPNNYLVRTAETYLMRIRDDSPAARRSASVAVRCSTKNPEAWANLENILTELSEKIRGERYWKDLTKQEQAQCFELYGAQMKTAQKAVELDPGNGTAWRHVSRAAALYGNGKIAGEAYWKAVDLIRPTDFHILSWGLQLYQPDWFNDPQNLEKVGQLAVSKSAALRPEERVELAVLASQVGKGQIATEIVRSAQERRQLEQRLDQEKARRGNR